MSTTTTPQPAADKGPDDRWFLGHPKGLGFLAATEFWERFSYYGMQSLLVLYLVKYLLLPGHVEHIAFFKEFQSIPIYKHLSGEALASAIFGTYAAMVYFTPTFGGLIADKLLGKTRTILAGAIFMAMGHFLMAFETSFLFALLCLIIGSGLFKGNLASQIGGLYDEGDLRRADAFQIYYLAINAGVIIAPTVTGWLGEKVAWHWGFGVAGVGMVISILIYLSGMRHLPKDELVEKHKQHKPVDPLSLDDWKMLGIIALLIPILSIGMLPNQEIFNAYLIWADKSFNLQFMGTTLPTTWLITLDSITSVSFLFLVALFFRWYGKHWREPDEITKIIIGCFFAIGGMLCLYMAAATQAPGAKIGLFWPFMFHVVNSIGFAMVLPIALALFMRLAPRQMMSTVSGLYTMIFFFSNALVGWIGGYIDKMPPAQFWLMHAGFAGFAGFVFIGLKFLLRHRLAHKPAEAPSTGNA